VCRKAGVGAGELQGALGSAVCALKLGRLRAFHLDLVDRVGLERARKVDKIVPRRSVRDRSRRVRVHDRPEPAK
jgi:hypothetical protein